MREHLGTPKSKYGSRGQHCLQQQVRLSRTGGGATSQEPPPVSGLIHPCACVSAPPFYFNEPSAFGWLPLLSGVTEKSIASKLREYKAAGQKWSNESKEDSKTSLKLLPEVITAGKSFWVSPPPNKRLPLFLGGEGFHRPIGALGHLKRNRGRQNGWCCDSVPGV